MKFRKTKLRWSLQRELALEQKCSQLETEMMMPPGSKPIEMGLYRKLRLRYEIGKRIMN